MSKRSLTSSLIWIFSFLMIQLNTAHGQAPEGVNYQAIARDNSGNALVNQMISVRFGILQGSATGSLLYEERYDMITTNDFGLFNLVIGEGAQTNNGSVSNFSQINWGAGPIFLRVEVDPGSGFENLGTSELVSVPYALYAKNSGSALSAGNGILIQNNTIINDGDLSTTNELVSSLQLNGNSLELVDAGATLTVDLSQYNDSGQVVDTASAIRTYINNIVQGIYSDTSASNELLTNALLNGQTLQIIDAGGTYNINLSQFNDSAQLVDTANAIRQDLAVLRTISVKDTSAINELITSATLNGQTLEISDAGGTYSISLATLNDSAQLVDTAAAIRNAIVTLENYLSQLLSDSTAALRTDLSTYSALGDTAAAIRSAFSDFGNVFSDGLNNINRLTYWNASDSITAFNNFYLDEVNNRIGIGTTNPVYDLDVSGQTNLSYLEINGAYIMPTADGAQNEVMMTDGAGNLSWNAIDTAECPTSMINIGGRICIETNERSAADWYSAASTCVAEGFKLPSWGEWYGALDNAALNNEIDNWEWIDGGTSNTVRKVGNGDLRATANDDPRNTAAFRCILILK